MGGTARARRSALYPAGYYVEAASGTHLHAMIWVAASHNDDGSMRNVTECDLYGSQLAEMVDRARAMALPSQSVFFVKRVTHLENTRCATAGHA